MTIGTVFKTREGWFAEVYGRVVGPWPMKEYAQAGAQVELRRI